MAGSDDETRIDPLPTRPVAGALPSGTLLNGLYRIEQRLGAGGMGEVYRATNIANDEQVAIKIIGHGLARNERVVALFRKEARVLARIHSPAVARLHTFAADGALGLLYFVTEFVAGESLLDRLKRQPGTPDEVRALTVRLLHALQAVHAAGAVHRDLSPDNVILPGGDVAAAKIIDFGIVMELDPAQVTIIGDAFAGKLNYVAAEQLGSRVDEVGPWSDLYSLGLIGIAFARGATLDMGHTIWTADSKRRELSSQVRALLGDEARHADEARRAPIDLSSLPPDLLPLYGRLLIYECQDRVRSAAAALAMLNGATPSESTPSPTLAPEVPVAALPRARSSWMWLATAVIVLLLITGGVLVATGPRATAPTVTPAPELGSSARLTAPPAQASRRTPAVASLAPAPCLDPIHIAFGHNASRLIGAEPLTLGALRRVELCRPQVVTVTGKAGPGEEAPAALARRRADAVADALRAQGAPAGLLRIRTDVATPGPKDVWQGRVVEIAFVK